MKITKATLGFLAILLLLAPVATTSARQAEQKIEMGTFYLVLLVKGPNWIPDKSPETDRLFQAHVKHIASLLETGKAIVAGPFTDEDRIGGILVTESSSAEEARALEDADPLVKSGRLSVEVLKWRAAKGVMKKATAPINLGALTRYYFGLIRRGPKWTPERTAETDKLQAAHMANIRNMAKLGKLVIAGPFEDAGQYAGVFVFKVETIEEARKLSDADPAVIAGRLVVDVHPWLVPNGSLP